MIFAFLAAFVAFVFAWKMLYFKRLSVVFLQKGSVSLVSVKPSRSWFRQHRSDRSCFFSLGNGYVAYQCSSDAATQTFSPGVDLDSCVYIFRVRFGRFTSVTFSDRCLFDILKKFN